MIVVLMGVSGSGKTTVGRELAGRLGWRFLDADDLHPSENVAKMRRGEPLDDADRAPWLRAVADAIDESERRGENLVLACSALKHAYQAYLRHDLKDVVYVCLVGSQDLIAERLANRRGHFMNPALLESQFAILEPPAGALEVDVGGSVAEIVEKIRQEIGI